jgi:hypothetical protein
MIVARTESYAFDESRGGCPSFKDRSLQPNLRITIRKCCSIAACERSSAGRAYYQGRGADPSSFPVATPAPSFLLQLSRQSSASAGRSSSSPSSLTAPSVAFPESHGRLRGGGGRMAGQAAAAAGRRWLSAPRRNAAGVVGVTRGHMRFAVACMVITLAQSRDPCMVITLAQSRDP